MREAAGQAFRTLHSIVGNKAIDEVVPVLLERLDDLGAAEKRDEGEGEGDEDDAAEQVVSVVEGLRQIILQTSSKEVLPYLVPALMKDPMTLFHAKALAQLSDTFSGGFYRYVDGVVRALVKGIQGASSDAAQREQMEQAAGEVMLCIPSESVHTLVGILNEFMKEGQADELRAAAAKLAAAFCSGSFCWPLSLSLAQAYPGRTEARTLPSPPPFSPKGTEQDYDNHVCTLLASLLRMYASDNVDLLNVA